MAPGSVLLFPICRCQMNQTNVYRFDLCSLDLEIKLFLEFYQAQIFTRMARKILHENLLRQCQKGDGINYEIC